MLSNGRFTTVRRATLGGLAVGLAAGAFAVGSAGAEDAPPAGPSEAPTQEAGLLDPTAPQPAPIGAVQADQAQHLRVLRRPRRSSDALPADALDAASPARFGRNPSLARQVESPLGKAWVVPGDGVVCLVVKDPVDGYGSTCSSTEDVEREGLTLGMLTRDDSTAMTLVPDGAVVSTTDENDRTQRVTPDASGVVRVDADATSTVNVTTDQGRTETPIGDKDDLPRAAG